MISTTTSILRRCLLLLAAVAFPTATGTILYGADMAAADDFFERQVRPLLAEKCFSCHGRGQRKGELSLDSRAGLMAGGESGPIVVAGKPEESLLIEAISYTGGIQMPPDARLSDREMAVLRYWVAIGLPWPVEKPVSDSPIRPDGSVTDQDRQFWSFQPIREPPLPSVRHTTWPRQPLDYFILSRLESEGLEPVTEADRRTYIRRATFDLLGLPPDEAEVAEFVADLRPDAYERLVERLLDSPRYGERWARHWLDVARYGEDQAHTFQARLYPEGYRYRDWVIDSLNRDQPIDQFLMEQIAGDLLPGEQRPGDLLPGDLLPGDLLPGEQRRQRLAALGFFALGPVYYADAGCAPKAKSDEYDDRIDTLCRGMLGLTVACARCHDHKFDPISTQDYYALAGVFASTDYVEAPLAPSDVVTAYDEAQAKIKQAEQRYKEAESDASRQLSEALAGRVADYLEAVWSVQNHRKVDAAYEISRAISGTDLHEWLVERWLQFLASDPAQKHPVFASWRALIAGQDSQPDTRPDTTGGAASAAAVRNVAGAIQSTLLAAIEARREAEAKYRAQSADLPAGAEKPAQAALPGETTRLLKELVDGPNAPLAVPKERLERLLSEESRQALAARKKDIERQKQASPPKYPAAHSLADGKPADSRIHLRGNVKDLGQEVPRRFLAILSPAAARPFSQGSGRLELAQAMVSPENPLTARVFINRVWQHHFGRGIVGTPSNFGLLGERPTHPELLDYLAARFLASGWSLKQLHREIMLSTTYRLASTRQAANHERDPENRLLWRMNRRRLDIESWRDATLLVAGNLDPTIGGPSMNLGDSKNRRRTLYAAVSRHELNPMLRLFDFPDPNLTSERRSQTTVPMQQLFVLNSEFMVAQARTVAGRLERENLLDDDARIDRLYRWLFGRSADDRERQLGGRFVSQALPAGARAGAVGLTRWEQYAQALLSTNEFLFVD